MKPRTLKRLQGVRRAIHGLQEAAETDQDEMRARVAAHLEERFSVVATQAELRTRAQQALTLYRGGMGSFQDVGTSVMGDAVEALRLALRDSSNAKK